MDQEAPVLAYSAMEYYLGAMAFGSLKSQSLNSFGDENPSKGL
jgi:hypothetical protein